VVFNVISLVMILTARETLGIDMNRADSTAAVTGAADFAPAAVGNSHRT
jgi:hypothetical protein